MLSEVDMENKDKTIECPNCGAFLAMADSNDLSTHKLVCKKCRKWIWYVPKTNELTIKQAPPRTSSSGKRFY